jgi:hypothetical protein
MLAGPPPADHDAAFSAKNGHKKHEKPRKSHSFSCLFVFLVANISYDKTKVSEEKTWPRNLTDVTRILKEEEEPNALVVPPGKAADYLQHHSLLISVFILCFIRGCSFRT